MSGPLRLAIVTDIHHGKESFTKRGPEALGLLRDFVAFANRERPDFVLDLGDRITDVDRATDKALLTEVATVFEGLEPPHQHMLGNHDVAYMSRDDNAGLLNQPMQHRSIDIGGYHLVFFQHDATYTYPEGFNADAADVDWLREDLAATALPSIVFSHVPLDGGGMRGNYWFQNNQRFATLPHIDAIQDALQNAGNVVLCVAGHVHWNDSNVIGGIPHLSIQSLSESYTTEGMATGAWATIDIGEEIIWRTHGRDPIRMALPRRSHNSRWVTPLPPFELLRAQSLSRLGLDGIRALILDMDGVLYRGDEAVPGSAEALRRLQDGGIGIVALTNNARATPQTYAAKLSALGMNLPAERIVTPAEAVVRRIRTMGGEQTVFVAGSEVLRQSLLSGGLKESSRPAHVVAGIDLEMSVATLAEAARHLENGARLIATNPDRRMPVADGFEPETGAIIAFLEAASGRKATVVGKPDRTIFELALERLGCPREQTLMVGDTAETDIAGALGMMMRSAHVATGNPLPDGNRFAPTIAVADLSELADRLLD